MFYSSVTFYFFATLFIDHMEQMILKEVFILRKEMYDIEKFKKMLKS